jgi:hypothetical protein
VYHSYRARPNRFEASRWLSTNAWKRSGGTFNFPFRADALQVACSSRSIGDDPTSWAHTCSPGKQVNYHVHTTLYTSYACVYAVCAEFRLCRIINSLQRKARGRCGVWLSIAILA